MAMVPHLALPEAHRRRLRTTNDLERFNQELKRRTRVAMIFPNESALERLVTALLMEQSEQWNPTKPTSKWKTEPTLPPASNLTFTEK